MVAFRPFPFFDRTLAGIALLAAVTGAACYFWFGADVFFESFTSDALTFLSIAPKMGAALLLAAYIQILVPRDVIARYLGDKSGAQGVAIATGIGFVTPGGPMTSFPVVSALYKAGTGRAALVAYLTAWSTLGFQRILVWEIPLLGVHFSLVRELASLPLPFVAAAISTTLPIAFGKKPRE
jgi:uncharacterized membrane protein YraQ (UPF0718 family)